MNGASNLRRSFWRFSLRELLLLILTIAALLGWGRAVYHKYERFQPTPFAVAFKEVATREIDALRSVGGTRKPDYFIGSSLLGRSGRGNNHQVLIVESTVPVEHEAEHAEALARRLYGEMAARGGEAVHAAKNRDSYDVGDGADEGFYIAYRCGEIGGTINVHIVRKDEQTVRVIAILDEQKP